MISQFESDRTWKEKLQLEKMKFKSMTFRQKLQYIWDYYKPVLAGILLVIILIGVGLQLYENSKYDYILSIGVANGYVPDDSKILEAEIKEALGSEEKYELVNLDTSYNFGNDLENADYASVTKFLAVTVAGNLDVFICDEEIYEAYAAQNFFLDLSQVFTPEECEAYGIQPGDHWVDITGSQRLADMQILYYEPVYLAALSNTENQEYIRLFVEYLKGE